MKHLNPKDIPEELKGITLFSGNTFDFNNPEAAIFTIEDVAHALSHICRFNGHCRKFYSVAQHSVLTSKNIAPEYRLEALVHDGVEFVINDMTKPFKILLPEYQAYEKRIEKVVLERFGLTVPLSKAVKIADYNMLLTEQRQLLNRKGGWPTPTQGEILDIEIIPWKPKKAKRKFLERLAELLFERGWNSHMSFTTI